MKFLLMLCVMCSSRNNPYPPHGKSSEIPRGRGLLKAKILEAKYGAKMEFPGGTGEGGGIHVGGVWIFSGTAQYCVPLGPVD